MIVSSQAFAQVPLGSGSGDVKLSFTSPLGSPIQVIRDPLGGYATFDVTLFVNVAPSVKGVTGLDFFLEIDSAGSEMFHINDYTLGTILFRDNSSTLNPKSGATPTDSSLLATRNGQKANSNGLLLSFSDSGSSTVDPDDSPYQVVQFKIGVNPATPYGTYRLSTTSDEGQGWGGWTDAEWTVAEEDGPPYFPNDHSIPTEDHASIMITVIPEPGATAIVGVLGLLAFAVHRRFLARVAA